MNGKEIFIRVSVIDMIIASMAPRDRADRLELNNRSSPVFDANPTPTIGVIIGATSIAPIITADESVIRPKVAILLDKNTRRKKSNPGDDDWDISLINFCFFSEDNDLKYLEIHFDVANIYPVFFHINP